MDKPNHLINETSPYLLQHAHNPVDWHPWNEAALAKARKENKPILLSIGYAACHWCHVMAHESFEDADTAELMNRYFINIKVDREERPDIDKIYQTAHYVLTQQNGGWPLTIFLSPDDLTPFYSGTYFPPVSRHQLPAFKEVLKGIADIYAQRQADIKKQNADLQNVLRQQTIRATDVHLSDLPIHLAMKALEHSYDKNDGGFTAAPKFPHTNILEFLIRENSPMAADTLRHMALGGINDQLEGGFYRYSVDAKWEIPHFEKMLYDNGALLYVYALASKQYHDTYFAEVAKEIANWTITTMQSTEGGYYASLDADSEGKEGQYYVWTLQEIESILSREEFYVVRLHYGFDEPANFEHHRHLHVTHPLFSIASDFNVPLEQTKQLLLSAKAKLLAARIKRIPPHRDEKILTAWNSLMIKGMMAAGSILNEPACIASAEHAIRFIQEHLWIDGRLYAVYKDGVAKVSAFLDDYAYLLDALLTSLEVRWSTNHLSFAIDLADGLLTHFTDEHGGFFFTADDHEKLLYRPKNFMDEAMVSGNAVAAKSLLTLGHLLGEPKYIDAAVNTLEAAWHGLNQHPAEHASLLLALNDYLTPPQSIVIRGSGETLLNWQNTVKRLDNHVYAIPHEEQHLPGSLALRNSQNEICAYVCQGMQCSAVVTELNELKKLVG